MSGYVTYKGERIPGVIDVEVQNRDQQTSRVSTDPETTRVSRAGLRQLTLNDFSGGFGVRRGKENSKDITRVRSSDGLHTHIPNGLFLPPVVTQQTGSTGGVDTARTFNNHTHMVNTTIGQTKSRSYFFVQVAEGGTSSTWFRTTSDINPALEWTGDDYAESVTAAAEVVLNNTRGILVAFDGATSDVQLITDPTTSPVTKITAFALTAGDRIDWIAFKPNLGPGLVLMGGKIGGVKGQFYLPTNAALLTAPIPLVLDATKDIEGAIATVTMATLSPVSAGQEGQGVYDQVVPAGNPGIWTDVNNILVDDGNDADYTITVSVGEIISGLTSSLYANFAPSTIPAGAIPTGFEVTIKALESEADDNVYLAEASLVIGGSDVGAPKVAGGELGTSSTTLTLGSSTDNWNIASSIRGADLKKSLSVRMKFTIFAGNDSSAAQVRYVSIAITYRMPGTQAVMPLGGDWVGHHPTNENAIYVLGPEFGDDATSRNVPRILWLLTFAYDPEGDRPTVDISKPATLLSHIESACLAQAGVVLSGTNAAGPGKAVRRLGSSGVPDDLGFNTAQGYTESWSIINLVGNDKAFWAQVLLDAGTAWQWWICVNGAWSAYSKRFAATSFPARVIGDGVDPTQRYTYIFQATGADTVISRQFFALNPLADPLVNNTTIVKENGVLTMTTPELDALGPEESLKNLLNLWFLGRSVSSTSTVRVRYSTDGGATFTTWTTFTSALSKSALATPVLFRTLIIEVGLDHSAGTSDTPNGLGGGILIEGASVWSAQRQWVVTFDPEDNAFYKKYQTPERLWAVLTAIEALSPVNTFKPGNDVSVRAIWSGLHSKYPGAVDYGETVPAENAGRFRHTLTFSEAPA